MTKLKPRGPRPITRQQPSSSANEAVPHSIYKALDEALAVFSAVDASVVHLINETNKRLAHMRDPIDALIEKYASGQGGHADTPEETEQVHYSPLLKYDAAEHRGPLRVVNVTDAAEPRTEKRVRFHESTKDC